MNWLAHTLLSEADIDFQLGNLLADLVRGVDRQAMSPAFLRGADCHRRIDAFTDSHPCVLRSRQRLGASYRRFSGVLMDLFYDHLLALNWDRYCPQPLQAFTAQFATGARRSTLPLPSGARQTLQRILQQDLLASYREPDGVLMAVRRISMYLESRFKRTLALEHSLPAMLALQPELQGDFEEFFPQLQTHVSAWLQSSAAD